MTHRSTRFALCLLAGALGAMATGCDSSTNATDAGSPEFADAGVVDAGGADAGSSDAGEVDAGVCEGGVTSCSNASDCEASATSCLAPSCVDGCCRVDMLPKGTLCSDNGGVVCNGAGVCVAEHCMDGIPDADETDVDCGGSCMPCDTHQVCLEGSDCASGWCAGNQCIECMGDGDCAPPENSCVSVSCLNARCERQFAAAENIAVEQTPGDCHRNDCDGNGGLKSLVDDSDVPTAFSACVQPSCTSGTPGFTNAPAGTDCVADGIPDHSVCGDPNDGLVGGTCVQCNQDSDCPGSGPCAIARCIMHVCDITFSASGSTAGITQVAGDCQELSCNGFGDVTSISDPNDLPVSNSECLVNPSCVGSPAAPSFEPAPSSTSCSDGSANGVCGDPNDPSVAGTCVECNVTADCGGVMTCVNNSCQ